MISKIINLRDKIGYFSQKTAGWKDSKKGFKNYLIICNFFISSGFIISLFLPLLYRLSVPYVVILYVIYSFIYYKYFTPFIEIRVDNRMNYELLDSLYEETNIIQRILSVIISIILILCSILIMIYSIYLFVKLWKILGWM